MTAYVSISFSCIENVDILYEYEVMDVRMHGMKRLFDK